MFTNIIDISNYMPHGMCLLWEPWLVALWAGSDLLIVAAYFAIPFALLRVLLRRDDIRQRGLIVLFASFILLCGITHALSIVTLWIPVYPLQGVVKLATGLVSMTTAIILFRLVPTLVAIPSLKSLEEANERLRGEIDAHLETTRQLREARDALEAQVADRTAALTVANTRLSVTAREAVHRSRNLIAVVASMARQSARRQTNVQEFTDILTGRLGALADATSAIVDRSDGTSADLMAVVTKQLTPVLETYPDKVIIDGPNFEIDGEAAQQFSLAIHELATNAQKHGALAAESAGISLTFHTEMDADGTEHLNLVWQEELDPARDPASTDPEGAGFGTRLLTQIIPRMLGGEANRTFSDGQMIYHFRAPIAEIRPDPTRHSDEAFADSVLDGNFSPA